jgi:tRNA(His) guanylyltransferase
MRTVIINNNSPSLTTRMQGYEQAYSTTFTKRMPIIVRLDGKGFSKFTNQYFNKPFDDKFSLAMQETVKYLMQEIQGCVFAFSQSDEISLFLRDYDSLNTESWFGSNLQKIVSVTASMATAKFNHVAGTYGDLPLVQFDSRAFILPKEEVVNYFIYRQHDGVRNSIQMLAQSVLGHKECQGKNNNILKEMLETSDNNWYDIDTVFRHGFSMTKGGNGIDTNLSLFKDDRSYIEDLVYIKSE